MIQPFLVFGDWGLLILRVALGIILVAHGWPKISNIKGTAEWMGTTFKPGILWAVLVAVIEFVGGLFIIAGFLTQLVAVAVAIQFAFITLKMNLKKGLKGGYEFDLLILAAALALLTLGSGALSVDKFFGIFLY